MILVLLPAYNEGGGIKRLLGRIDNALADMDHHVIVVNDGSSDDTEQIVTEYAESCSHVMLCNHPENRGLGRAMDTGIEYVCSHYGAGDFLVTMDADNTHDPELIRDMVVVAQKGADLVIASRFQQGGGQLGVPVSRRFLSWGAWVFFKILFPMSLQDYTSGYRLYRLDLLKRAIQQYNPLIEARGFVVMAELLVKLHRLNPKVAEVPLLLRYDQKAGPSKIKLLKTILEYIRIIGRIRIKGAVSRSGLKIQHKSR